MDSTRAPATSWLPLFPTPVLCQALTDSARLNRLLIAATLQWRSHHLGIQRTNAGGWHSEKNLAVQPVPAIQAFLEQARPVLSDWLMASFALAAKPDPEHWQIELWANVNQRGHSNRAHDHFRTDVIASAFYYVQCGGAQAGGQTIFINQQSVPNYVACEIAWRDQEYSMSPQDGMLVVFPSWLGHRVEPYAGDGDRITLAFNASHPAFKVKRVGDRPLSPWLKRLLGRN